MKSKFTFLVVLFLLTTSIYAVKQTDVRNRKHTGNFLKSRLEMPETRAGYIPFQQKMGMYKQANSLKSAQAVKQRLDSYTYQEWEDGTFYKGKVEFVYDVNGMLTHEREYEWDETAGKMVLISVSESSYDASNNLIQHVNTYLDETTNQFVIEYKTTYSYDKNGNMTQSINNYWDVTNNKAAQNKTDYTYDSGKNLIQKIMSYFDESTNKFVFWYKDDYTYNGSGKETQQINYIWDSYSSKQWELSSKTESTYDSKGNLVLMLESNQTYVNNILTLVPDYKEEYTYDTNGLLTQIFEYVPDNNNQWKLDDKQVNVYDDNGNKTQWFYYFNWDLQTNQWKDIEKEEFTYDNRYTKNDLILPFDDEDDLMFTHMLTELKGFYQESSTKEWITYFQLSFEYSSQNVTTVTQPDAQLVSVYPNPCSDFVSVSFPGNYSLASFELFDVQGRKLISKELSNTQKLSLKGLNSGMYLYNLNIDGKVQLGKLIKGK